MVDSPEPEQTLDEILPGLFLSDYKKAENLHLLERYRITHILTLCEDLPPRYPDQFTYCVRSIDDRIGVSIQQLFPETNAFIDQPLQRNGRVLVHCLMGVSRSATAVIAYVMWKRRMRFAEALAFVRERHPDTDPNGGFVQQLKNFQCTLFPADVALFLRCKCGALLFHKDEIVSHANKRCTRYFVRLAEWMRAWGDSGDLLCYLCGVSIGRYENEAGLPCGCGRTQSPAYLINESQLQPSR